MCWQHRSSLVTFTVPKFAIAIDSSGCCEIKVFAVIDAGQLRTVGFKWRLESSEVKIETIDFVRGSNCKQVAGRGLVDHVSAEFGNSHFEVSSILSVELYVPVNAQKCKFRVVLVEYLELDHF
jgi:hypothetical protein